MEIDDQLPDTAQPPDLNPAALAEAAAPEASPQSATADDNPAPAPDVESPEPPPREEHDDSLGVPPAVRACAHCRLFKPVLKTDSAWMGDCRVMPSRGMFPATAPPCNSFLARAAPIPRALKPAAVIERRPRVAPRIRPARSTTDLGELEDMTREELKELLREALYETDTRIAAKWEGGTLVLKPANPSLQAKEMPIDALFHKVVMVRDRLRVLEQKVNAHAKLTDAEKVDLQQYVTRCYGSLTSFNVLFADKEDHFVGERGKGE